MGKVDDYRGKLESLKDWDGFLMRESGLPGPRANLELAQAVAETATIGRIEGWLKWTPDRAPSESREEFLTFCGVHGLGRLAAEGRVRAPILLKKLASDPRPRIRDAAVSALQKLAEADMDRFFAVTEEWSTGKAFERRGACAALCEPHLLAQSSVTRRALKALDRATAFIEKAKDRESDGYAALKKGLVAYWNAVAAVAPAEVKAGLEKWLANDEKDVRWIAKEVLKKRTA
jgi:hypothetical protein